MTISIPGMPPHQLVSYLIPRVGEYLTILVKEPKQDILDLKVESVTYKLFADPDSHFVDLECTLRKEGS